MKKSLKLLIIAAMLAMTTCCVAACGDSHESGSSESPNVSDTTSTGDESSDDPVIPTYTLSFECSVANVTPIEVQENGVLSELPAIPEKAGYTATWQIDGTVIDATTVYAFTEDKTAVAVYVANTDTPYTVMVYLVSEDGYTNITGNYADLVGLVGTTDATVDMTAFATENLPAGCMINMEKSVISGTIAGDGSLALEIYYDYIAYTLSFDCSVESVDSIKVQEGGVLSALPAIPEKAGYSATWQIDGEVIDATTVYLFTEDKTAVAVYVANTDTPYTVSVYFSTDTGYVNVTENYTELAGLVGTTDTTVDITTIANDNVPANRILNTEKSVLSGTIAGDGSLVLEVYYDYTVDFIFKSVADTSVDLDFETVYGDQEYSSKVQFHKTAWNGTVSFALNENAPEAPVGATHVTFYVYTGHDSYAVNLKMGREKNFGQVGTYSWQPFKFTIAEYEVLKNSTFTLTDPNGNSQGKWLYLSAPVFTTEDLDVFYGTGITKDTSVVYGEDSFSYKVNANSNIMVTSALLDAMGEKDSITFYVKGDKACNFNLVTQNPWDGNTSLATTVVNEWVAVTLSRAQVEALVSNPFNKFLQARIWETSTFYISETLELPVAPSIFSAVADTETGIDTGIVYGEQENSYKVQFHKTAWNGTVSFTFNENAPKAPEGATHVTFYTYIGHLSYNVSLTMGRTHNVAQSGGTWKPVKFTVAEYEVLKTLTFTLQDPNGNSQGKWLYISHPVFTTEELDTFYGSAITKVTDEVYGNDSFSYKFEMAADISCSMKLLELLGDGNSITFYVKGTAACNFNLVTKNPWDGNTVVKALTANEWTAVTLTRAQVEELVSNPFNKVLQARIWSASTFYISETVIVK